MGENEVGQMNVTSLAEWDFCLTQQFSRNDELPV
jgi:hypothetical protein